MTFVSLDLRNINDRGYLASQSQNESFCCGLGDMLFAPFGMNGILISLGGGGQSGPILDKWLPTQGDFKKITIYDLDNQSWHCQKNFWRYSSTKRKFLYRWGSKYVNSILKPCFKSSGCVIDTHNI